MDVTLAVQKAIVLALRANAGFAAAAEVWDTPPQHAAVPYVQIDYVTKQPWPAKLLGWELTVNMQIWTGSGSAAEALEIVELIDAVLDDVATLAPTGFSVVRCWNEYTDTSGYRGEDGYTRGVPVRYRLWVQESP